MDPARSLWPRRTRTSLQEGSDHSLHRPLLGPHKVCSTEVFSDPSTYHDAVASNSELGENWQKEMGLSSPT